MCASIDWWVFCTELFKSLLLPIVVSAVTTFGITIFKERKKKKEVCLTGISVIEALQEEVFNGVNIMRGELQRMQASDLTPPQALLPKGSWQSMATIPDDVNLLIITLSRGKSYDRFLPKDIRTRCKDYFQHMCQNWETAVTNSNQAARLSQDWRPIMRNLIEGQGSKYLESAEGVHKLLSDCKALLQEEIGQAND